MRMVEAGRAPPLPDQTLEINPTHPIITSLSAARTADPPLATKVASQLFSNALVSAGLMDDPRVMLPNVNALMADVLRPYAPPEAPAAAEPTAASAAASEPTGTSGTRGGATASSAA